MLFRLRVYETPSGHSLDYSDFSLRALYDICASEYLKHQELKNLRTQTLGDLPQRCFVSTGACGWSPCHGPQCWRYRPRLCCSDEMRSHKRTTGCHGGHPPWVSPGQYPLFPHYFIKALIAVKAQNGHLPLLTPIDFYLQQ